MRVITAVTVRRWRRRSVHALLLFSTIYCVPALPDDNHSQKFAAELENVRALPFGFTAVCESGDLKIRSDQSATFAIRNSLLCEYRKTDIAPERRDHFVLCSNNPKKAIENDRIPVVKCRDLVFATTEI